MNNTRHFLPSRKARIIGLLRPLKDVTVTAGETATFDCELSYEDIPVEWYLKGKKLEPDDKVKSGPPVAALPFSLGITSIVLRFVLAKAPPLQSRCSCPSSNLISAGTDDSVLLK